MRTSCVIICFALIFYANSIWADRAFFNRPIVKAGEYGGRYAKSVPAEQDGDPGKTYIYKVGRTEDTLECEYGWYAPEIYLGGTGEETLVRLVHGHNGLGPVTNDFAIGIYRNGKAIREYSCSEITNYGFAVSRVFSAGGHLYSVFGKTVGFRRLQANTYVFEVEDATATGNVLTFNLDTGELFGNNAVPVATDEPSGTSFYLNENAHTLIAKAKDGKTLWAVDVIKECNAQCGAPVPNNGEPKVRAVKLYHGGKVNVVIGKHDYATIDIQSGAIKYDGAD